MTTPRVTHSFSKLSAVIGVAAAIALLRPASGDTFVWNNVTGKWSDRLNWSDQFSQPSLTAPSGSNAADALNFGGSSGYTATNDVASPFALNRIQLDGTTLQAIAGSPIRFAGADPQLVQVAAGAFDFHTDIDIAPDGGSFQFAGAGSGAVTVYGVVSGGALNHNSAAPLILLGDNTYSGGTTLSGTGSLVLNGNTASLGGGTLTFNGGTLGGTASAVNIFNNVVVNGGTVLLSDALDPSAGQAIRLHGIVSGAGTLNVLVQGSAGNTLYLTNPANTFSGTLNFQGAGAVVRFFGDGGNTLGTATIRYSGQSGALFLYYDGPGNNGGINFGNNVEVAGASYGGVVVSPNNTAHTGNILGLGNLRFTGAGGTFAADTFAGTGYKLRINGTTTLADNGVSTLTTLKTDIELAGPVSGAGAMLFKNGVGTLTLSGAGTYTGGTVVDEGRLLVNNTAGSGTGTGPVTVRGGAVLGGRGTIGGDVQVNSGGRLAPGVGPGILTVAKTLTLQSGSLFEAELFGSAPGNAPDAYDQLVIASGGSIDLGGATLDASPGYDPSSGDLLFLVNNQNDTGGLTGTFAGLADGTIFTIGGQSFQISYFADVASHSFTGGNDVAIQPVPEPAGIWLAAAAGSAFLGIRTRRRSGCD